MEIQVIGKRTKPGHQGGKVFFCHPVFRTFRTGTEGAGEITDVGYFQIDLVEPIHD